MFFMKTRRAPIVGCFIANDYACSFYFQTSENCLSSPLTGPMVTAVPLLVFWSSQMLFSIIFFIYLSRHSRLHACRCLVMWCSSGDSHLSSTPPPVTRSHALLFVCLFVCLFANYRFFFDTCANSGAVKHPALCTRLTHCCTLLNTHTHTISHLHSSLIHTHTHLSPCVQLPLL